MDTAADQRLSLRYGKPRRSPTKRTMLWLVAGVVVLGLGFLIWAAFGKGPQAEKKDIGFTIVDATRIDLDFQVTKDPQRSAKCELQALDESFGVVGWRVVDIPSSPEGARTTTHKEPINTDSKAVSAVVQSCWVQ